MQSFTTNSSLAQLHEAAQPGASIDLSAAFWGHGGVHGGLALSLLLAALRGQVQGRVLQQVSGQFRRALRGPFSLAVREASAGKTVSWWEAEAIESGQVALTARAVYAASGALKGSGLAPPMPAAPAPLQCPLFTVPPEFVPFASRTEIRPVGAARPFSAGVDAMLTAWLRLKDDEAPPDALRLTLLMDALAPSWSACLHRVVALPTLTYTVTPADGLVQARSPWVLLQARTVSVRADGWLLERMEAWSPEGVHLGSAEQLRLQAQAG